MIEDANKKVLNKQFVEAQDILNEAKNYASNNGVCTITSNIADDKLNNILYPATYQRMLIETSNLINNHKYDNAIQKYIEANKYYDQYKVSTSGLNNISTYQYIFENRSDNYQYTDEGTWSISNKKVVLNKHLKPFEQKIEVEEIGSREYQNEFIYLRVKYHPVTGDSIGHDTISMQDIGITRATWANATQDNISYEIILEFNNCVKSDSNDMCKKIEYFDGTLFGFFDEPLRTICPDAWKNHVAFGSFSFITS